MAQHRNLTPVELPPDAPDTSDTVGSSSLALARRLSIIFSPPLVAIATYLFVAYMQPQSFLIGAGWSLLIQFIQMGPGAVLYTYRRKSGAYRDADVSVRQDRNELYLVGTIAVIFSIGALYLLNAPQAFQAMAIGTLLLGLVCGAINLLWKISMHAAAMGTFAMIVTLYRPAAGAALWLIALAVGWARVRTHNHTTMQVLAGLATAAAVMYIAFMLVSER